MMFQLLGCLGIFAFILGVLLYVHNDGKTSGATKQKLDAVENVLSNVEKVNRARNDPDFIDRVCEKYRRD
jgi:hypothetical protein